MDPLSASPISLPRVSRRSRARYASCWPYVFALYVKTKNFHRRMTGQHFRDFHHMLDDQAEQPFAMIDPVKHRASVTCARASKVLCNSSAQKLEKEVMHTTASPTPSSIRGDLTRLDRIVLHFRCLYRDRKYRWHLAGIWRELCPSVFLKCRSAKS